MTCRSRNCWSPLLLLLLPALIAALTLDHEQRLRKYRCERMCPGELRSSPAPASGAALRQCPGLRCPRPVCPAPLCPSLSSPPSPPHACPPCPAQTAPSPAPHALAWKTLKARAYTATPLGYYKYHNDKKLDWFDAQILCESEGAHLLILNSEQEDEFIRNAILPGWIHIGIHHLIPHGTYTTVLGQPVDSTGFRHWLPGHFVWNITSSCGFINKRARGMGMGRCSDAGPFICEL